MCHFDSLCVKIFTFLEIWKFSSYPCILKFKVMAKANLNIPVSGKLGDISMYKMRGVDHLILRSKGGPTEEQIKNAPEFVRVRENMSEFAGYGKAAGKILNACYGIKHLSDYSFTGDLGKICKIIQKRDETHLRGERSILLSQHGKIFEGFNTCREHPFDSVVKQSPSCVISRSQCKATLSFPEMIPDINIMNPWNIPFYRLIIVMGIVPDMVYGPYGYAPVSIVESSTEVKFTGWNLTSKGSARQEVDIEVTDAPVIDDGLTLWVSVGIEFGVGITASLVQPAKRVGCGKILMVG